MRRACYHKGCHATRGKGREQQYNTSPIAGRVLREVWSTGGPGATLHSTRSQGEGVGRGADQRAGESRSSQGWKVLELPGEKRIVFSRDSPPPGPVRPVVYILLDTLPYICSLWTKGTSVLSVRGRFVLGVQA